jgi:hypothetical protein
VLHDQRHLRQGEQDGDRHRAPDLEGDPGIVGEIAPDDLVEHSQEQEEDAPANGQLAPAFGVELEGGVEDIAEQRLAEQQAAEQREAEQRVDDGRLHLDEGFVLQVDRQRAEHQHDDAGDERHDRQVASTIFEITSEMIVAAMNSAVATNSGPPSSESAGNFSTSHWPRRLAKKKIISGPSSSASFSIGFCLSAADGVVSLSVVIRSHPFPSAVLFSSVRTQKSALPL